MSELSSIQSSLKEFARNRNWEKFHSPKNLVMALTGEVGELNELFQWLTEEQSSNVMLDLAKAEAIKHEVADVFLYLIQLAQKLDIDLIAEAKSKISVNELKYPIDKSFGKSTKYSEL